MRNRQRRKTLSDREQECLGLRSRHFTAKEAAKRLNISPHTVAMHLRNARLKLETFEEIQTARSEGLRKRMATLETVCREEAGGKWLDFAAWLAFAIMVFSVLSTIAGLAVLIWILPQFQ